MKNTHLLERYLNMFEGFDCNVTSFDYGQFDSKKNLLMQLSEVENSSMAVFDMYKKEYAFVRSKFDDKLGYPINDIFKKEPSYFFALMPEPDLKFAIDTISKAFAFLGNAEKEKLKEYKLIFEYRLSNPAGNLFHFLQQCVVLEQDKEGHIWMVLILIDLIPGRSAEDQLQRKMLHIPDGKICLFNDEQHGASDKFLSKRETEILGLLSEGYQSKEISERLFISVNTVNNHRQKIIEKLNAENTYEALNFARTIGII